MQRFSRIQGLTDLRRLPRLAKIHLGIKATSEKGVEYPKEVDYFVLPEPETQAPSTYKTFYQDFVNIYGPKPKVLDILIPSEDPAVFFPNSFKMYGSGAGLKCRGDGQLAERIGQFLPGNLDPDQFYEIECQGESCPFYNRTRAWVCGNPECEHKGQVLEGEQVKSSKGKSQAASCAGCGKPASRAGGCKRIGNFLFVLPKISMSGIVQIDTSSFYSITNINSTLGTDPPGFIRGMFGRVSWLLDFEKMEPLLLLKREPTETFGAGQRRTHYILNVEARVNLESFKRFQQMPAGPTPMIQGPNLQEMETDLYPASIQQGERESLAAPKPTGRTARPFKEAEEFAPPIEEKSTSDVQAQARQAFKQAVASCTGLNDSKDRADFIEYMIGRTPKYGANNKPELEDKEYHLLLSAFKQGTERRFKLVLAMREQNIPPDDLQEWFGVLNIGSLNPSELDNVEKNLVGIQEKPSEEKPDEEEIPF